MELKHLKFFCVVAKLEHITKAADILMVSQPFLTKIINQLEDELGVELFDHIGRKIQLNKFGRGFYDRASRILDELDNAKLEMVELARNEAKTVTIATNVYVGISDVLFAFHIENPKFTLVEPSATRGQICEQLQSREIDLAICSPPLEEEPSGSIKTERILNQEIFLMVPPGHRWSGLTGVPIQALDQEEFVATMPGYGMRDTVDTIFEKHKVAPQIILECNDLDTISQYVSSGLGCALLPHAYIMRHKQIIESVLNIIGIDGESIGLSWNENRYKTHATRMFMRFIADHYNGRRGHSSGP